MRQLPGVQFLPTSAPDIVERLKAIDADPTPIGKDIYQRKPNRHVHVIYSPDYDDGSYFNDLCSVFTNLGFITTAHFISSSNLQMTAKSIPLEDIVYLHVDVSSDIDTTECSVARFFESNYPFVIGSMTTYTEVCARKSSMNEKFAEHAVPYVPSIRVENIHMLSDSQFLDSISKINPPFFVKVDEGYNSLGTGNDCVLHSVPDCINKASQMVKDYGPVVIQPFLSGREFTIAVSPSQAYHPIERLFMASSLISPPDGTPAECQVSSAEASLIEELRTVAHNAYKAVGGTSYGRVDIRMDGAGKLYVLEVNNTCSFGVNSYFSLSLEPFGLCREDVIKEVLAQDGLI